MFFCTSPTATGSYRLRFLSQRTAMVSFVLLSAVIAGSWGSRPRNVNQIDVLQLVDTSGQSYYANAHPYIGEPLEQLVERIPELRTLQPAPDQQALPIILARTGEKVHDFFRDIVDLVAQEEIIEEKLNAKRAVTSDQHFRYSYLILLHRDEDPQRLEEYRTDSKGKRVEPEGFDKGFPVTSGFALKCIHFLPTLRSESTFRYLGDEVIGPRNTYVVAFAQRPGQATITSTASGEWGTVPILVQGIAWVDKNSFQIIRMRTDLLAPRSDIGFVQQTTEVTFSEVQLQEIATPFWLPRDVNISAVFRGHIFRNEHRYTHYERFRVSIKIDSQ